MGEFLNGDDVREVGEHADEVGVVTGVVDRAGVKNRRKLNLKNVPTEKGKDRDEYPPAVVKADNLSQVSV